MTSLDGRSGTGGSRGSRRSFVRQLLLLLTLGALVVIGLGAVAQLKFSSFLSASVNERLEITAATLNRDFAAATDVGLSLSEVANGEAVLRRAGSHDPNIESIVVFGLDGTILHGFGTAAGTTMDAETREAFRLAGLGITGPTWSTESGSRIGTGIVAEGSFGQPLGGIVVEYGTAELGEQRSSMMRLLARDGLIIVAALSLLMGAVLVARNRAATARATGRATAGDDERGDHHARTLALWVSAALIVGVGAFGALILRDFNDSLAPELERRATLIGHTVRDDTERALDLGIPMDRLVGLEEYFQTFLAEFDELDYLALVDGDGVPIAVVDAGPSAGIAGSAGAIQALAAVPEGGSTVYRFDVAGGGSSGRVEVGVDGGYVRSRLDDLALDVGVILIVALVVAFEVTLALSDRVASLSAAAASRTERRRPGDLRLVLLVFAIAEELNKSFLPLFIESSDNPVPGLDTSIAISLPIVAYLLTMAIASPLAGKLVQTLGQRRLLMIGFAGAALSHLGMIFAGNVLQIMGLRALTGVGYALATVASMEYLLERLAPGNRLRSISVFVTVIMGGTFAGTALGGIFADRLGYDAVFLMSFLFVAAAAAGAMAVMHPHDARAAPPGGAFTLGDMRTVLRRRSLLSLLAGVTIPMNVLMAAFLWYLVPLTMSENGSNASAIARALMVYYLVLLMGGSAISRLAERKISTSLAVGIGSVLSGAVLLLPAARPTALGITFAVFVVAVGHAAVRGPQVALAIEIAENEIGERGRDAALAAMRSLERLGSLVGLLATAVLATRLDLNVVIGTVGVVVALAGLAFVAVRPRTAGRPADG